MNFRNWKMEKLLKFPFLWKADMTIDFWIRCHRYINDKKDENTQIFKEDLNRFAKDWEMWPKEKTWKDTIDTHEAESYILGDPLNGKDRTLQQFEILDTVMLKGGVKRRRKGYEANEFVGLLAVIRDKYEHKDCLTEDQKRVLGWFQKVGEQWIFMPESFVKYWFTRFPQLTSFLCDHYRMFPDFKKLYHDTESGIIEGENIGEQDESLRRVFSNFPDYLQDALRELLEQGFLDSRYLIEGKNAELTLEFMTLRDNVLETTLRGSNIIGITISKDTMVFKHFTCKMSSFVVEWEFITKHKSQKAPTDQLSGTIFLTKKLSLLEEARLLETSENIEEMGNRIIMLASMDIPENSTQEQRFKILKTYQNMAGVNCIKGPVRWEELSNEKRDSLLQTVELLIHGKQFLLRDVIETETLNEILKFLEGNELNNILKTGKLEVLKNHELPVVEKVYLDRRVYNRAVVDSKIFSNISMADIFVIMHDSFNTWQPITPIRGYIKTTSNFVFSTISLNADNLKVIHIEDEVKDFDKVYRSFENYEKYHMKAIHFLKYIGNECFEWQTSHGRRLNLETYCEKFRKDELFKSENEFLESLQETRIQNDIIFIADLPGMGKSQLLSSFVTKIASKQHPNGICVHFPIPYLMKMLFKFGKTSNLSEVINLACREKFEEKLVNSICRAGNTIRVELFLDGLDEISYNQRNYLLLAIKTFHQEMPRVRIWITLRDYMLDNITTKFGSLGFMLKPLSEEEQVNFLVKLWLEYAKEKNEDVEDPKFLKDLEKFAWDCLKSYLSPEYKEIAGIPLQCKIINEIFQGQVRKRNFVLEVDKYSIIDLYRKLFERKDEVYLREKIKIPEDIPIDSPFIKLNLHQIDQILVYLAIKLLFSSDVAKSMEPRLIGQKDQKTMKNLLDVVEQHGMVQKVDPIKWMHRTCAEYCIAQNVSDVLFDYFDGHHKGLCGLDRDLYTLLFKHVLGVEHEFDEYSVYFRFKYPNLCNILDKTLVKVADKLLCSMGCEKSQNVFNRLLLVVLKCSTDLVDDDELEIGNFFFAAVSMELKNILIVLLHYSPSFLATVIVISFRYQAYHLAEYVVRNMNVDPVVWQEVKDFDDTKQGILHRIFSQIFRFSRYFVFESEKMTELFKKFADIRPDLLHDKDAFGQTPFLAFACRLQCNFAMGITYVGRSYSYPLEFYLDYFRSNGADLSATDLEGNTALHLAIDFNFVNYCLRDVFLEYLQCYIKLVDYLYTHNIPISLNSFNKAGQTPVLLLLGSINAHKKFLQPEAYKILGKLERFGANFNLEHEDGSRLLHKLVENNYPLELIQELLRIGVNVNATNSRGQCAVHIAVEKGNIDLVKFLVEFSPESLSAKDHQRKRSVDYDCNSEIKDIIKEPLVYFGMFGCLYSMKF